MNAPEEGPPQQGQPGRGSPGGDPDPPREPAALWGAAGCLGVLMPLGAWFWLYARDRLGVLGEQAHAPGSYGPLLSLAVGLVHGLLAVWVVAVTSAHWPRYRAVERRIRLDLGDQPERALVWIALLIAVGDEFLFRLAAQDHLGPVGALALYAAANWMPRMTLWTMVITLLAVGWAWMVHAGLGLLAATTSHAIFNYLTLRRLMRAGESQP